jgi:molecular chaperone GrpE
MKKTHPGEKHTHKDKEHEAEKPQEGAGTDDLQARLEEKEKEAAASYDRYLRAVADLENYKKRAAKDRSDYIKYANENILRDLLAVLDNMERAREHAASSGDITSFLEGLKMIQGQFGDLLSKYGLEIIETKGREFDPNFHEAVMQVPGIAENDNKIAEEFQKGYILNGRLLRPAKVSVTKHQEQ